MTNQTAIIDFTTQLFAQLLVQPGRRKPKRANVDTDTVALQHSTSSALSLADRIEQIGRALTAEELAKLLNVSKITVFKQAKAGRIPSFRIGTCVRFDPKIVAKWLRTH